MLKKSFIQFCLLSLLFAGSLFSEESLFLRATGKCQIGENVFNAQRILDEWEKNNKARDLAEGEQIGQLKGLMKIFIKTNEIDDDDVADIQGPLDEDFVRNIWSLLPNANKTEEKLTNFLQALRDRELL